MTPWAGAIGGLRREERLPGVGPQGKHVPAPAAVKELAKVCSFG